VPASSTILAATLTEHFPHKSEPIQNHVFYLHHALTITKHTPVLEEHILTLVIDKLLKIDVEIQIELDELDDLVDEDEEDTEQVDQNGDALELDSDADSPEHSSNIKRMVDKMDTLLDIVMQFIKNTEPEYLNALFHTLLYIFERIVVHTHKSKYTQSVICYLSYHRFIMFYICSLNTSFSDDFLGIHNTHLAYCKVHS